MDRFTRTSKRFGYSGRITTAVAGVDSRPAARLLSHAAKRGPRRAFCARWGEKRDVRPEPPVSATIATSHPQSDLIQRLLCDCRHLRISRRRPTARSAARPRSGLPPESGLYWCRARGASSPRKGPCPPTVVRPHEPSFKPDSADSRRVMKGDSYVSQSARRAPSSVTPQRSSSTRNSPKSW